MGTTDNVLRRRGGMARSDDRRLAELTRALFADARDTSQPDATQTVAPTRGRKKRPASARDDVDGDD